MNIGTHVLAGLFAAVVGCGGADGPSDGSAPSDGGVLRADGGPPEVDAGGGQDAGPRGDGGEPDWPSPELPPPEWVDVTVGALGTCAPLEACGGDVVDTWDVTGGCFEVDIESAIEACPGAMVTRREGRARGRVAFGADGTAHRVAQGEVEADVTIPAICAAVVSCPMIEAAMRAYVTEASCIPRPTGDCECTAITRTSIDHRDAYRIEGNEIVSVSSGKRWEYCVEGDALRYRDTSPSEPREPGVIELGRQ